jgi:hypothetical protein
MSAIDSGEPTIPSPAASAVKGPAIALLVVAILGILFALAALVNSLRTDPGAVVAQAQKQNPQMNAEQAEWLSKVGEYGTKGGAAYDGVLLLASVLVLFGAIQMLKLRSYGLAMTGSILSLIPCISPCCILGIPFGIWSLIVLLRPEVKQAFH